MILSWVLTFLLFIVAFVFSLIYGPRQEIADYTDDKSRKEFLNKTVVKRFEEINKIVLGK